jgi:hypothetical protein
MNLITQALRFSGPSRTFFSFVFSILGWGLLESWLFTIHAAPSLHATAAVPAACLVIISMRRYRDSKKFRDEFEEILTAGPQGFFPKIISSFVLFFALGYIFGTLVVAGLAFPLGITGIVILFAPWPRWLFDHNSFILAGALFLSGAITAIVMDYQKIPFIFPPIAVWIMWLCALTGLSSQTGAAPAANPMLVVQRNRRLP